MLGFYILFLKNTDKNTVIFKTVPSVASIIRCTGMLVWLVVGHLSKVVCDMA